MIFGCSNSGCRKAVLPVIERPNALLWYPSLYEGFEYSPNVIYTGAAPNQNSIQLAAFLMQEYGSRFFFVGSDYIFPREMNRLMRDFVESQGGDVLGEAYVGLDATPAQLHALLADVADAGPSVVFSTIVGRAARDFYRLYGDAGIDRGTRPIASLTMAEGEIREIGPEHCTGHITAATYFGTVGTEASRSFVQRFRARFGADAPVSMWSEIAYAQVHLFAAALTSAGSLDATRLARAAAGVAWQAPGGQIRIEPENQHAWLTPRIGRVRADGEFDILWEAKAPVRPDPYLTASAPAGHAWLRA